MHKLAILCVLLSTASVARADDTTTHEAEVVGGAVVGTTLAGREGGVQGELLYQLWSGVPFFVRASGFAGAIHGETWGKSLGGFVGGEGRLCMREKALCFVGGVDAGYEAQLGIQPEASLADHGGGTVGLHAGVDAGTDTLRVRVIFDAGMHHDDDMDPPYAVASHVFAGVGYRF